MMILLVDAGVAYKSGNEYILEDVEVCQVLEVLSEENTNIYSPMGSKCWIYPVGSNDGRKAKTVDMIGALLTLQAA
jgi:hypothetical protein